MLLRRVFKASTPAWNRYVALLLCKGPIPLIVTRGRPLLTFSLRRREWPGAWVDHNFTNVFLQVDGCVNNK
jgi:hypothetical protein